MSITDGEGNDIVDLAALVKADSQDRLANTPEKIAELEGFADKLHAEYHEEKDAINYKQAVERLPVSTPLVAETGDRRTLQVSRHGRGIIGEQIKESLPSLLSDSILSRLLGVALPNLVSLGEFRSFARFSIPTTSAQSMNLHFDPYTVGRKLIEHQWRRDLAGRLADAIHAAGIVRNQSVYQSMPEGLWICDPDVAVCLRGKDILPVIASRTAVVLEPLAELRDVTFECHSMERGGHWELGALLTGQLWWDSSKIVGFVFPDLPTVEYTGEVV